MKKRRESQIENEILKWLDRLPSSRVHKNARAGFLVKDEYGTRMMKHKNHWARKKQLDITMFWEGTSFHFEVKTPKEFDYIKRNYRKLERLPSELYRDRDKKKKHYVEQIEAIKDLRATGNKAHFVCSLDQVKKIIEKFKKERE